MSRKPIFPRERVQRVSWEPDYDHEAWSDYGADEPLTYATRPDAFYRVTEPAYPANSSPVKRKAPHRTLSRTQLRKRLSRAGLSGIELQRVLNLIKAGPGIERLMTAGSSLMALGWDVKQLADAIGEKLARKVLRFVRATYIVRDEYWELAKDFMPVLSRMFTLARSHRSQVYVAAQTMADVKLAEMAA